MQKPTVRRNRKKEITLRIDFHLDLRELAVIATRVCYGSREYLPKTQEEFEKKIRYHLYKSGCIDEGDYYSEDDIEQFMDDIKQLYSNYEW